jgi:hypothetical protein
MLLAPRSLYLPLLLALGCAHTPAPCLHADGCPASAECLAARCVPFSAAPVASTAKRRFASPSRVAIGDGGVPREPGPSAVLGTHPDETLYLDFPPIWRGARISAAFLVLTPTPASLPGDDVLLEVLRVRAPWTTAVPTRGHPTRLALPRALGIARSFPDLPVRIDVTALVRYLARNPAPSHGIALRATHPDPPGIALSTGLAGTIPPRLEIYAD